VHARAEEAGHRPVLRGSMDLVVARSFGPPAVTAECASPFLRVGGWLVVSEPPSAPQDRWPDGGLAELGLRNGGAVHSDRSFKTLVQDRPCPDRYARRNGVPAKRPLF
jgi:16S rRNA (guanine527-N7)-methyltransferase